uniref:Uncharacterized protein n=1 Tax=Tanacetum cinerariifolium TaxID=118510 RepID=A0A699L9N7_TANCI|nr:hypothetical protein [Tanacetum cinerariifolium]
MKKKQQVELDEAYARKLQEEINQDIDWEVAMDHVKQKAKEEPFIQRYQVMKKRPQTEAQARRNMIYGRRIKQSNCTHQSDSSTESSKEEKVD